MISSIKKLWRDRRGTALVIAGAAMPLVVGAAGLAVDTIQWTLWKRQLQRAADSAAIAGVYAKIQSQPISSAITTDLAKNHHTGIALLTGYPATTEPVHATGLWTNGVKVQLGIQKRLNFSSMFMSTPPIIKAEGTAATIRTGVYCVISLEDTAATGIEASGNGNLNLGCGLITNSTSLTAAVATGSATVAATTVAAVGDVQESTRWGNAELLPFTVKQPDPFADITPDTSSCPGVNFVEGTSGPGCYSSMTFSGDTTLQPGVYVIDGGNLRFGASAHVTCTGCTFVLTNSNSTSSDIGSLDVVGTPELDLAGMTTGTYSGILIFQDRRAQTGPSKVNKIVGDANSVISGAFYFPNQELQIGGNALMRFTCGQFVARTVDFTGNGGIANTCTTTPPNNDEFMGLHVRLVA